jgi:hypothetical protein
MKKNVEYQLTPKGEELSKKMDQKNTDVVVEVDKIKNAIVKKEAQSPEQSIDFDDEDLPAEGQSMSYQQAKKLKGKSFGTLLAEQEGGLKESFRKAVSLKTQAKVKRFKEKIDPMNIVKFMTFGSNFAPAMLGKMTGRSKEDIANFTGAKAHPVSGGGIGDTATKVGKLGEDTQMLDILMKIYTLMDKSHQEDIKRREEANQFADENLLEKEKKRKELLAALKGKKDDKEDQKLEKDTGKGIAGIVSDILNAFGGAKTAISLLTTLGGFVASPLGVAFLGAVAVGAIGAWMWKQIKADPQSALEGKGGVGMAVSGLGSEGQLPSWEEEQKDKAQKKSAEGVDKKGISGATLKELEDKRDLLIAYGDPRARVRRGQGDAADIIKAKQLDDIDSEIAKRKSSSVSNQTASVEPEQPKGVASTPVESPNSGQRLNSAVKQNIEMNLAKDTEDPTSVVNNNSIKTYAQDGKKIPMPAVRNLESTFQNMILYSTRVV